MPLPHRSSLVIRGLSLSRPESTTRQACAAARDWLPTVGTSLHFAVKRAEWSRFVGARAFFVPAVV